MTLTTRQETELVGLGDTMLHYHLADRATNAGLQSTTVVTNITASPYAISAKDDFLLADTSAGDVALTLPVARNGREYEIIKITAGGTVTVTPTTPDTICGETDMLITQQWTAIRLKAVSSGWVAI